MPTGCGCSQQLLLKDCMEALEEVTVWNEGTAANHVYLLDGTRMLAYIARGTTTPYYFRRPITISRSGRKFKAVTPNPFDVVIEPLAQHVIQVAGSKGAVYTVDTQARTCTCQGYTFRGTCKHIKELE